MPKLTQDYVGSLAADGRDRIVFDDALPGFGVRVTKAGKKIWIARTRAFGKSHYFPLGAFSDLKATKARTAARQAIEALKAGT